MCFYKFYIICLYSFIEVTVQINVVVVVVVVVGKKRSIFVCSYRQSNELVVHK